MIVNNNKTTLENLIYLLIVMSSVILVSCGPKPPTKEVQSRAVNFVVTDEDGNPLEGVNIDVRFDDGITDSYTTNTDGQTTINIIGDLPAICDLSYGKEFVSESVKVNSDYFSSGQSHIEKKVQLEKMKTIVYGYVFDKTNNKPIPGEPVRISTSPIKTPESIYTNKDGMYEIASAEYFEGAELTIEANVNGYNKNTTLVTIDSLWHRNKAPNILLEALPKIGNKITHNDTIIIQSNGAIRTE